MWTLTDLYCYMMTFAQNDTHVSDAESGNHNIRLHTYGMYKDDVLSKVYFDKYMWSFF